MRSTHTPSAQKRAATRGALFWNEPDVPPVAVIPQLLANAPAKRGLRRTITREEGRALEMIGHAADYLRDCYFYEGDEMEVLHSGGSTMKAIGILGAARIEILQSLPLRESRTTRLWNALFHRNAEGARAHNSERSAKGADQPSSHPSHHGRDREVQPQA
jgi:hypothetical protein